MISPRELMIGNIVMLNGAQVEITEFHGQTSNQYEPIHLNEDWLKRFGFDVEWTVGGFLKWEKQMPYEKKFKLLDRRLPHPQYHSPNATIQYVHQLQNLYFSLTGEELKLN